MSPSDFQAFDLRRVFLGDLPWLFLLEVAFRTVFMYVYAFLMIRLLGKRGIGNLSPFDFVIIIALGSATGDPMFYADVPLGHAMVVLAAIIGLQKLLFKLTERSERIEALVESKSRRLVKDGCLEVGNLDKEDISREEVFVGLRVAGVEQLGQVKRAYLEPSGKISVLLFSENEVRSGLPVYPPLDERDCAILPAGTYITEENDYACFNCAKVIHQYAYTNLPRCETCSGLQWQAALPPANTQKKREA